MSKFDYDVLVVGSGFGGSVTAMRATEKGYRVGVLESGRRVPDSEVPTTSWDLPHYLWFPALELYGIQRLEVLDNVFVMCGAGVGGGSHVYAQTLYVPPPKFFEAPEWAHITDWADELAPYYDQARRMLGVQTVPFMDNDIDRVLKESAKKFGTGASFNKAPAGVFFGEPGVEVDDPYFGGVGPRRTGCINCANCMVGCGHNAKNKLNTNYLYLAEKFGAEVHPFNEVYEINPLEGGGFEVKARHPGWIQRGLDLDHHTYTTEQLVISAHAYGSAKLLTHMQHDGNLANLSTELGKRTRTNSEELIMISRSYDEWEKDPGRLDFVPGVVGVTSAAWPDPSTSIEPCFYSVGSDVISLMTTYLEKGPQDHPMEVWVKELLKDPKKDFEGLDARHWSQRTVVLLCMQTHDNYLDTFWKDGMLHSKQGGGAPVEPHIKVSEDFAAEMAKLMGAGLESTDFELINRAGSAHYCGGITIGEDAEHGAVDPYQRAFGYPGLHVIDGSTMPANPGVNPTLSLTALSERALSFWPNKGEADPRPPLGSGYQRLKPVKPRNPIVPAGAPGELRLDATADEIIPKHGY